MAQATSTTDLSQFLPPVPKTPQVHIARDGGERPRRQRRNSTKPASAKGVTATVTPARRRASPPTAPAVPSAPEESKRDKFLRIGGGRMVNVLRSIRLLGNLANRGIYEWRPEDVEQMRRVINDQLDRSFRKFEREQVVRLEQTFHFEV
jgi:hypothetical protein